MMLKKKILAAAIGALVLSGSAVARDAGSTVSVAPGGKGDLLVAPLFMAAGGWKTELTVINTDTTNSSVAKVVIHAEKDSAEVRDFLIYLTPGDVWVGTIEQKNGVTYISSTDDSSVVAPDTAGNGCPAATKDRVGFDVALTTPENFGYVNVFQTRLVTGLGAAPVSKDALLKKYSELCAAGTAIADADTANVLTGNAKILNSTNGNELLLPMTALQNYGNKTYHVVGGLTSFADVAASNKAAVETALWAADFTVPFKNAASQATYATVTFPTKETYWAAVPAAGAQHWSSYTPFLNTTATRYTGSPAVRFAIRNEEEKQKGCFFSPCNASTLPNEVSLVNIAAGSSTESSNASTIYTEDFTKGWVNMNVQNVTNPTTGKAGAPAIVTVLNWSDIGGGKIQGNWYYAPATR